MGGCLSDEASKAPPTPKGKKNAPEKNPQKTKEQELAELAEQQETERREKEDEERQREAERLRKEKEAERERKRKQEEMERQERELRKRLLKEKEENERRERQEVREREKIKEAERKAAREAEEHARHLENKKQRERKEKQKDKQKKGADDFGSSDGLDDLINNLDSMLEDAPKVTKLAPIGGSTRNATPRPMLGSKPEFEETKTKCFTAFLDGTKSSGGFRQFCKSLYCRGCDMDVERFPDKKWDSSVDYLFFRNYHPNHAKLAPKLHPCEGTAAYCCQCTWRNIDTQLNISLDPKLKWFCTGCSKSM